ncbi:transcriptional regulator EutR [Symmachiella macrocystis]|uniref:Transcriptional regulator EutR n=2 Tax=Symmachiella macrocystis TaxID=2527985 RepID=A0A5C6AVY7_9PLAN|nr:transcriptional regulator EutR [Symmachiella macrocystis]
MKSHCFQNFDEFADSIRDVDAKMMLHNAKRHTWSVLQTSIPGVDIQVGSLGSGNIVEGQARSDGYLFYLPLTVACAYTANGTVLDRHSFMVLEPGCEFSVCTQMEHDWCSFFVPNDIFARSGNQLEPTNGSSKMICRVTPSNVQIANRVQTILSQIMTLDAKYRLESKEPATTCAAAELTKLASSIVGTLPAAQPLQIGRRKISRHEIIFRSKKFLEERYDEPILVGELAAAAEVSERTLRTAFNEYYGLSPARYLQLRQLHQVQRALRAASPDVVSVSDAMLSSGVWEFGRFASRYRRTFGELPSETLKTRRNVKFSLPQKPI